MSKKQEEKKYISLAQASELCKYSQDYLSLRARQGKLKAIKRGRNWATTKQWLDEYAAKNCQTEVFGNASSSKGGESRADRGEVRPADLLQREVSESPDAFYPPSIVDVLRLAWLSRQFIGLSARKIWKFFLCAMREKSAVPRLLLRIFAQERPLAALVVFVGVYLLILNGLAFVAHGEITLTKAEFLTKQSFGDMERKIMLAGGAVGERASGVLAGAGADIVATRPLLRETYVFTKDSFNKSSGEILGQIKFSSSRMANLVFVELKDITGSFKGLVAGANTAPTVIKSDLIRLRLGLQHGFGDFFNVCRVGLDEVKDSYRKTPANVYVAWNDIETTNSEIKSGLANGVNLFLEKSVLRTKKIAADVSRDLNSITNLSFGRVRGIGTLARDLSMGAWKLMGVEISQITDLSGFLKEEIRVAVYDLAFTFSVGLKEVWLAYSEAPENMSFVWREADLGNESLKQGLRKGAIVIWYDGNTTVIKSGACLKSLTMAGLERGEFGFSLMRRGAAAEFTRLNNAVWLTLSRAAYALRGGLEPKLSAISFQQTKESVSEMYFSIQRGLDELCVLAEGVVDFISHGTVRYYRFAVDSLSGGGRAEEIADGKLTQRSAKEGIVVVPSTDRDEEVKQKIKDSFSDEVKVEIQDENSGIITPVFRERDGDRYLYMMVPISEQN